MNVDLDMDEKVKYSSSGAKPVIKQQYETEKTTVYSFSCQYGYKECSPSCLRCIRI